ncbi:CRISPR-associated endonuclease Cas6 [Thiospirillum jenense]|uniref:Uncharacterized protein n=1 Tax=Thiospirillum jenense TaxID=1653858 RepID=A0A839HII7_9GAMM|nr:CRISPR-associated endonuclease Cas6 [Thiospirillum jenense]MBB1126687.1 hypothetical protein [Thiospirillum jenense]
MYSLATIPYTEVELDWGCELPGDKVVRSRQLRGALANAFRADDLFHQHDPVTGKSLYRYPRVQYRWWNGHGVMVGWHQAAPRLLNLPWLDLALRIGNDEVTIADAVLTSQAVTFGVSDSLMSYRLLTPALLFNPRNYQQYQRMNKQQQMAERERLLIAALLIAMRGLEVTFSERLYAVFAQFYTQTIEYKQERFLGIGGVVRTNAVLPNGFAFGHGVSHGFGELITMENRDKRA